MFGSSASALDFNYNTNKNYTPMACKNCGRPLEVYGKYIEMNHWEEGWHRTSWADNSPDYFLCNDCYSIVH